MRHDSETIALIERLAQERLKYEVIFSRQTEVLRTDIPKLDAALDKVRRSPFVAKPGQRWQPTLDEADEYMAYCDDICQSEPQDFDDRVRIAYAAHGALMCILSCKFARQPERVQLAILRKHYELDLARRSQAGNPTPPSTSDREPPLSKSSAEPRSLTAEERRLFENPEKLHGKQFVLPSDTDRSGMYEVIGYHKKRDKSVQYEVLFDDCVDPILLDAGEVMGMLEDSLYVPN